MSHHARFFTSSNIAFATCLLMALLCAQGAAHAQQSGVEPSPPPADGSAGAAAEAVDSQQAANELPAVEITVRRENRVSKGATNLPMEIKDTPQTISTIERQTMSDFALGSTNEALKYGIGLTVDEWETNRTSFSSRGFDVILTQIDGLGVSNAWGIVTGHQDAYLFEKIELVRGANGLLTGVGNASGTINYVRKRPTNKDGGEVFASIGSHSLKRVGLDYSKVLTADGKWAARIVAVGEDKDSYIRALGNRRGSLYAIAEGQVGDNGILALGLSTQTNRQRSPMWGSLTLPYADGTQAEFDRSASTAQDWTRWNTRDYTAFVEYTHMIGPSWEAKFTYNHARGKEDSRLFYAYTNNGYLNDDNTGLIGWPYRDDIKWSSNIADLNLSGSFNAFGREHEAVIGLNHAMRKSKTWVYAGATFPDMPAFPYAGDVFAEPAWAERSVASDGDQSLTRLYAAGRFSLTDRMKGIVGLNAIHLKRNGTAIYGHGSKLDNEKTSKLSPYFGLTYDLTPDALVYASYSDIFQAQDRLDINRNYLPPAKGVNAEVGIKAEWLDRKLMTSFAIFSAKQKGLATEAGFDTVAQQSYYEPKDVKSRGFDVEVTGRLGADSRVMAGFTSLKLTGPDGSNVYQWVPRRTLKLMADTRIAAVPQLRVGAGLRWQSDTYKEKGARQNSYAVADLFAAWQFTPATSLRLNINNVMDKKYLRTVQFGAIYGAPRTFGLTLEHKL